MACNRVGEKRIARTAEHVRLGAWGKEGKSEKGEVGSGVDDDDDDDATPEVERATCINRPLLVRILGWSSSSSVTLYAHISFPSSLTSSLVSLTLGLHHLWCVNTSAEAREDCFDGGGGA